MSVDFSVKGEKMCDTIFLSSCYKDLLSTFIMKFVRNFVRNGFKDCKKSRVSKKFRASCLKNHEFTCTKL